MHLMVLKDSQDRMLLETAVDPAAICGNRGTAFALLLAPLFYQLGTRQPYVGASGGTAQPTWLWPS